MLGRQQQPQQLHARRPRLHAAGSERSLLSPCAAAATVPPVAPAAGLPLAQPRGIAMPRDPLCQRHHDGGPGFLRVLAAGLGVSVVCDADAAAHRIAAPAHPTPRQRLQLRQRLPSRGAGLRISCSRGGAPPRAPHASDATQPRPARRGRGD